MSINSLATMICKSSATAGGAKGQCHCFIAEAPDLPIQELSCSTFKSAIDSKRTLLEMQQEREFWLYGLMKIQSPKIIGLGEYGKQYLPEKSASTFIRS